MCKKINIVKNYFFKTFLREYYKTKTKLHLEKILNSSANKINFKVG